MAESSFEIPQESFMLPGSSSKTEFSWEDLDPRDSEIERLKRTNFNLRLRVFHLEGCLGLNKDDEKTIERGNAEQELLEELQREIEKKDELLQSARDLILSLKKELIEKSNKQELESIKHQKDLCSSATEHISQEGAAVSFNQRNSSKESVQTVDYHDMISSCRKIVEKLDYFTLGGFREELERINGHLSGQTTVHVASDIFVQFLNFIDRLLASILQGEILLRPNNELESQDVQTEPIVALSVTFMSNLINLLKYLVDVRLQLQGIVQGDETSHPAFPDIEDTLVGDELLKLLSSEVVDWDHLIDQIKLQKEDLNLTYDALEEAENLRDEAIEALEAVETERDTATKLIELLKELALSAASTDVIATQRILEEFRVDDDSIDISNDWKANVLNSLQQQNDTYHRLEEALTTWRRRWDSFAYDDLHEFKEDGTFTCFVKDEKVKLEQKVHDLLKSSEEEQEAWNSKFEALKEERDLEMMRCQQLEDESVRMVEEQIEFHKKELEQLQNQLHERTKTQENLERELEATYGIIQHCKVETTEFLGMMERLECFLLSLDESILESIRLDCMNEEILESSCQVISQMKQRIASAEDDFGKLLCMFQEQDKCFDSKMNLLDREISKLVFKVLDCTNKLDCLRKELCRQNEKIEEQQKKICALEDQIEERDFQYECREEEHRKQQAIIEEEKESTLVELSTSREECRLLRDEWRQLCEQLEDVTSALEQHEAFSKQLEEEKENFETSFYRVDEERKQIEHKYKDLYSLYFEVKECLLREVRIWKAEFSTCWRDYQKLKETIRAFQEGFQLRWFEIVSALEEHCNLLWNRVICSNDETLRSWKPQLEFTFVLEESNFFSEVVKQLDLFTSNIKLLSQEAESTVVASHLNSAWERRFVLQNKVTLSIPERTCPFEDDDITVTTNSDREAMERICNFIRSWDMEGWLHLVMRKLFELKNKLTRLEDKQGRALSMVKLPNVRLHGSVTKEFSAYEPRIRRRFSFSPATGQRVSPLQYLRWREREQEEGILRQMKEQWFETQRYRNM
ncbi:hypothetical protein GpartN1_g75.t1 [Galdieria partita]|uniref:Centrosomin N-terminal motif 1 domain-containing protein n=1 Tax=Galdieria partita TaxID=83374 RepID=A0A9C7PQ79_9RHOD|nr:hypothetical protein GpartN1_g75.t1 [Galdieria partita]